MIIHTTRLLRKRRDALLKRLTKLGPFIQGSVVRIQRRCGYLRCRCATGGPGHTSTYLTYAKKGKTHTLYIPIDLEEEVVEWSQNNKQLKALIRQMDEVHRKIVNRYVKEKRGRAKQKNKRNKLN